MSVLDSPTDVPRAERVFIFPSDYDVKKQRHTNLIEKMQFAPPLSESEKEEYKELSTLLKKYLEKLKDNTVLRKKYLQDKGSIYTTVYYRDKDRPDQRRFTCVLPYNGTTVKDLKKCIEDNWNRYSLLEFSSGVRNMSLLLQLHILSRYDDSIDYSKETDLGIFSNESQNLVPLKNFCQQDDYGFVSIWGMNAYVVQTQDGQQDGQQDVQQKEQQDAKRVIDSCLRLFNPQSKRIVTPTPEMENFISLIKKLIPNKRTADINQMKKICELSNSLSLAEILYIVLMLWIGKYYNKKDHGLDVFYYFERYKSNPQNGGEDPPDPPLPIFQMPKSIIQELEETIRSIPKLEDNVKIDKTKTKIVRLTFKIPTFGSKSESEYILKFGKSIDNMMESLKIKDITQLESALQVERINIIMEETFQKAYLIYSLFYGASTEKMVNMMLFFKKDPSILMGGSRKKNNKKTKRAKRAKRTKRAKSTKRTKRA